ncbi:hypothetical protein F5B20DRAFT_541282 [Whalleya microplaca]|nr:hypothetical protein F5B20DRAFT_541282 [Whalleya microplaca]
MKREIVASFEAIRNSEAQLSQQPEAPAGQTHYDVLGVPAFVATDADIKAAYLQIAKEQLEKPGGPVHSDMYRINDAYHVLTSGRERCWYDFSLNRDADQYADCSEKVSKENFEEFQKKKQART